MKTKKKQGYKYFKVMICVLSFFIINFIIISNSICAEKVITLTLSSWDTEKGTGVPAWKEMAKDIEAATNGKVKIKMYHAQALGKAKEHFDMAVAGTADITFLNVGFTPGRFPITDLTGFAHAPNSEMLSSGLMTLMEKGYLDKEYSKVKLLYVWTTPPSAFIWSKSAKAAQNLEGLKGKKIRVATSGAASALKSLGANPVAIPMPEVYTSLERGVIDCTFTTNAVLEVFGLHQICDKVTIADGPGMAFALVMNKKAWEKLPDAAKEVLEKNKRKYSSMAARQGDITDQTGLKKFNIQVSQLSKEEKDTIKKYSAQELYKYLNKVEDRGFPAKIAAKTYWESVKNEYGIEPFFLQE